MNEQRKVVVPSPENSETPLAETQSWVTPNRLFFVRNHFEVPQIDDSTWRLTIDGCVQRAVSFDLEQFLQHAPVLRRLQLSKDQAASGYGAVSEWMGCCRRKA